MTCTIEFGDLIRYFRAADNAFDDAICIGAANYEGNVIVVATTDVVGVPIDVNRCEVISAGHWSTARCLRDRFDAIHSGQLRPEFLPMDPGRGEEASSTSSVRV